MRHRKNNNTERAAGNVNINKRETLKKDRNIQNVLKTYLKNPNTLKIVSTERHQTKNRVIILHVYIYWNSDGSFMEISSKVELVSMVYLSCNV